MGTLGDRGYAIRVHGRRLAALAVRATIRDPGVAIRFVRTRARRYAAALVRAALRQRVRHDSTAVPPATVLHLAVASQARGIGAGTLLVEAFVDQALDLHAQQRTAVELRCARPPVRWGRNVTGTILDVDGPPEPARSAW